MRRLAVAGAFMLIAALGAAPVSAELGFGGISGMGTGYSTTSETSGYGSLATNICVVGQATSPAPAYARCSLEYDIGGIPDDATITSALLRLHSGEVTACAELTCKFDVAGYVGDATTTIGDVTAGDNLTSDGPMGAGVYVTLVVTDFVQARFAADDLIAGFRIGRNEANPDDDRVTISHSSSANPPVLEVRYGYPQTLTIDLEGGPGRVTSAPAGIDCPTDCVGSFIGTSTVFLTAEALNGGTFELWDGDTPCDDDHVNCKMRMPDGPATVVATFSGTTSPTPAPTAVVTPRPPTAPPATVAPVASAGPAASGGPVASASPGADPSPSSGVATFAPLESEPAPSGSGGIVTVLPGASTDMSGSGGPADPAAGTGGSMVIPIMLAVAVVVVGGLGVVTLRGRRTATDGGEPPEPPAADA